MNINAFLDWAISNKLEFGGTIFGLLYVWFSIRQNLLTWPAGIITSILYFGVFLHAGVYAAMSLQFYYLIISCYGWWSWSYTQNADSDHEKLRITPTSSTLWLKLFILSILLTALFFALLIRYTDSEIPFGDAVTTSLSILATWMLTRKKLEHWFIWIGIDLFSASLYHYKGLYSTAFLYLAYAVMASIGYYEWQREPQKAIV